MINTVFSLHHKLGYLFIGVLSDEVAIAADSAGSVERNHSAALVIEEDRFQQLNRSGIDQSTRRRRLVNGEVDVLWHWWKA
jgi:hypothetical protein